MTFNETDDIPAVWLSSILSARIAWVDGDYGLTDLRSFCR